MQKTYSEMTNGELIHILATEKVWDLVLCLEVFERAGVKESFDFSVYRSPFWSEETKALFDSLMGQSLLSLVKQGGDYCPLDDEVS